MPHPKEVFDDPNAYWAFLTANSDDVFEGQHFDRKEACRKDASGNIAGAQLKKLKEQIQEVISAFSQSNKEGGLLVLGISSDGTVRGVDHLTEGQLNDLTRLDDLLVHHHARVRLIDCSDHEGNPRRICLIYAEYTEHYICETPGNSPKAYKREGRQNIFMDGSQRDIIRREKRIVDFENTLCCSYDASDLDEDVVSEFQRSYLVDAMQRYSVEEMLRQAGAIEKTTSGYAFTNAGLLFFAINPQRIMPWSYVRLLRFSPSLENETRGLPTFERNFAGSITRQIRNLRTFFKESGFFKAYQKRSAEGGFIEEPEFPFIAVDESLVNAIAHRDYGIRRPIEAESYRDAFVVRNAGRLRQRDRDVPEEFSLNTIRLDSAPRNSKLIEWLKTIKTEQGTPFVRALSEGTETMRREMENLGLPAPTYNLTGTQTQVTLLNDIEQREALLQSEAEEDTTEFANLFSVNLDKVSSDDDRETSKLLHRDFMASLRDALSGKGWYVDRFKFSRLVAHRRRVSIRIPKEVEEFVKFYPAYSFQLRRYATQFYLCIDYELEVKNVRNLQTLLTQLPPSELIGKTATIDWHGWRLGRILTCDVEAARVKVFDYEKDETITSAKVIPNLPKRVIETLLKTNGIHFDLNRAIKEHSLALQPNASRTRLEKTEAVAQSLSTTVFPLRFDGRVAALKPKATALSHASGRTFAVRTLREPNVVFGHGQAEADIRDGITRFGAYMEAPKTIELLPICTTGLREGMASLIERLKAGKYKYKGSERTFHARFTYNSIVTIPSDQNALSECERLIREHPEWAGNDQLERLFLIYCPEEGYMADDETSPYYRTKRFLLEHGIPCQMVDTPTITNPDWKDLNLALNVVAKCGVTPWVLPDAVPDADFFVGLSYTQSTKKTGERFFGYANVFNSFGKWMFYSGNKQTFSENEKTHHFYNLVKRTLEQLTLSETPTIHFHYSAKFSKEDKAAILNAARSIRPKGIYSFVWINKNHSVRLYDLRAETDGSLSRGSYVITTPNQFFLSTTGYNPYRKSLGTPQMLEVNVWIERPDEAPKSPPDLRSIAVQILGFTKLNWASTDSLCAEPITTKYAGDIAYLTSAFVRQTPDQEFRLHPVLERTPWFI
jgi:predicted HTH transcriptional regulator